MVFYCFGNLFLFFHYIIWFWVSSTGLYSGLLSNSSLMALLTYSQVLLYFSNNLPSFIKKDIYSVSWMSFLYEVIFVRNIHRGKFFSIFVTNKSFKCFFTKRNLIVHYYFINSCIFIEIGLYVDEIFVFRFNYCRISFFFSFFYMLSNTFIYIFWFIMFCFFQSNQYFVINL